MLDVFSEFQTDPEAEDNGVWRDIGGGARILVARIGNTNYSKLLNELFEQNQEALNRKDEYADQLNENLMIQVLARTVLKGWENLSFKKQPMPYSEVNARILLGVKDFRQLVVRKANEVEMYKSKEEAEQGNG